MTEYLDELIHLFRKARAGTPVSFQDEEVKNRLLAGLPAESLGDIEGYFGSFESMISIAVKETL